MGVFADKLKEVGYNSFEARFAALAFDAIRKCPYSIVDAWRHLGETFGFEYMRARADDIKGSLPKGDRSPPTPLSLEKSITVRKPRQRITSNSPIVQSAKAKIISIAFGYKMSDGRDIAEIGAHELDRFAKDGALCAELKKELPVLTNNMRFANLGELITKKQFDAARARANV